MKRPSVIRGTRIRILVHGSYKGVDIGVELAVLTVFKGELLWIVTISNEILIFVKWLSLTRLGTSLWRGFLLYSI